MSSILAPVSAATYRNGHQDWYGAVEIDAETGEEIWRFDAPGAGFDTAEIYRQGNSLRHTGFDPASVQRLADGRTLIADWDQGVIVDEDGDVHRTFTHDLLNDTHEIRRTDAGTYLIASTGMDTLVLLDEDFEEMWRWHMWEHVDPTTRPGEYYPNSVWFRNPKHVPYSPDDRYHLNYATVRDGTLSGSGGPQFLCSALNYGVFVVDFETDEIVSEFRNLDECHNPYQLSEGYLVPESGQDRVVAIDEDGRHETIFEGGLDFVKDADPIGGTDEWLLTDTKNSRILRWAWGEPEPHAEFFLGEETFPYEADYLKRADTLA